MALVRDIAMQPYTAGKVAGAQQFLRQTRSQVRLIANYGIAGDAKAGRHPQRQICLLSAAWVDARKEEGYQTGPGAFGEQIVIAGLSAESLAAGRRLLLGTDAVVEITKPRTNCARLAAVHGPDAVDQLQAAGVFARVVQGGVVAVGDAVLLISFVESERVDAEPVQS